MHRHAVTQWLLFMSLASIACCFRPGSWQSQCRIRQGSIQPSLFASFPGLSPGSKYGNYNYSNYYEDIKDVDPKDSNWEYTNPLEDYPENADDDEILEALREKKQLSNDLWQSTLLRDTQGGNFVGSYEVYAPRLMNCQAGLGRLDVGSCSCTLEAGPFDSTYGVAINVNETFASSKSQQPVLGSVEQNILSALLRETRSSYPPDEFRTSRGNQCVGGSFTFHRVEKSPDLYVSELGIREGMLRVRVRYGYRAVGADVGTVGRNVASQVLLDEELRSGRYHLELFGFVIIKEALANATPIELQPLFGDDQGSSIYDPQAGGEPYVELKFAPKLTLLYPRGMSLNTPTVLTVQWEGPSGMRYQADRKFENLNGPIKTLELTEIQKDVAESFPPTYKPVELLK